jgi:nucleoside-diphosphate-sugar epimerase
LVDKLVAENWQVTVIDNLFSGFLKNLDHHGSAVTFIEGSITDQQLMRQTIQEGDTIWHFAAMNSVPRSIEFPWETNDANVNGTLSILLAAKDNHARRVIYSGSSSAYGDAEAETKDESLPAHPISPYGLSKFTGEEYCRLFSSLYGLEAITLRYFNVFGPRQNPTSPYSAVIPLFIAAMLEDRPITVFSDGDQSRDFTYVDNVIEANYLAGTKEHVEPGVYNVACGDSTSVNDVLKSLEKLSGYTFKVKHKPPRVGDIRTSKASIDKISDALGYEPRVTFRDGVSLTLDWYRTNTNYFPS